LQETAEKAKISIVGSFIDHDKLKKFDPAVNKKFLIALSGLVWLIVGIILCRLSAVWLSQTNLQAGALLGITGAVTALLIYWYGFSKLVNRNIERIMPLKDKVCIFAFQPWKSYLIIIIMVGIGTALRHSPLPKPYLSVIYIGFGGAMILSSIRYFKVFLSLFKKVASRK
jgi:hypothetical protein